MRGHWPQWMPDDRVSSRAVLDDKRTAWAQQRPPGRYLNDFV